MSKNTSAKLVGTRFSAKRTTLTNKDNNSLVEVIRNKSKRKNTLPLNDENDLEIIENIMPKNPKRRKLTNTKVSGQSVNENSIGKKSANKIMFKEVDDGDGDGDGESSNAEETDEDIREATSSDEAISDDPEPVKVVKSKQILQVSDEQLELLSQKIMGGVRKKKM
jgi:hypothetical protein